MFKNVFDEMTEQNINRIKFSCLNSQSSIYKNEQLKIGIVSKKINSTI